MKTDNKFENVWILLCERGILDNSKGLVSAIDIVEKFELKVSKEALKTENARIKVPIKTCLASYWRLPEKLKENDKYEYRVQILSPKGEELASFEKPITKKEGEKTHKLLMNIDFLVVTNIQGIYKVKIVIKDEKNELGKAEYPFEVKLEEV